MPVEPRSATSTRPDRALYIEHDGTGLTHQALGEALAEEGWTVTEAKVFARNMAAAGYVKSYAHGRADKREPRLYRPDAALALAVIHRAAEAGFVSPAVRKALGEAMQKWPKGQELPGPRSPGTFIMGVFAEGQRNFGLDLTFFRQPGRKEPVIGVRFRQATSEGDRGTNFPDATDQLVIRSSWTCPLDPILSHLMRRRAATH